MATATKTGAKTAAPATKPAKSTRPTKSTEAAKKAPAKSVSAKSAPSSMASAAKPAVKQPATAKAGQATPAKKTVKTPLDVEQRRHYVEVAAYFMAERRGFMTGCESEDWLAAEAEIDRLFLEGKLNA